MIKVKGKLVIIDDDAVFCRLLTRQFEEEYSVTGFTDPEDAVRHIGENSVDVVLTDLNMPKIDGLGILKEVKSGSFDTDVIVMTAYAKVESAVEAMKKGAYDYIIKPFTMDELSLQLKKLFEKRRLSEENIHLKKLIDVTYRPENMVGESEAMKDVYRVIERVALSDATVLVTGETGTGKELVAKAVHFSGRRKEKRFVSINSSTIPVTLLESELFGYTRGAFSGASSSKQGLFEYADGGTIFLDEIADMPFTMQAKLLRVLQGHAFMPIGSNKEVAVDVRIVAATNRDLTELIGQNKFRADLYYRINVLAVHLPPLRERKDDIPLLIKRFLKGKKKIHSAALSMLSRYYWPGNVRELKNLIERLTTFADADMILPDDLPPEIHKMASIDDDVGKSYAEMKRKLVHGFDRAVINKYLVKNNGNISRAAEELKLDRANFQRLMRRYQITSGEFRADPDHD